MNKMDYDSVETVAKGFDTAGDILRGVDTALQALLVILRTTAFMGAVGGWAVESYISNIKPHVAKLGVMSEEYAVKLRQSIEHHKTAVAETTPSFDD
jgi:hypothetical protein